MRRARGRLLLSLILLTLGGAAAWKDARAGSFTGAGWNAPVSVSLSSRVYRPGPMPTSGEPDVGQSKPVVEPHSLIFKGWTLHGPPATAAGWIEWIGRVWAMHWTGTF